MESGQPTVENTGGQLTDQMLAPSGTTMPGHTFAPVQQGGAPLSNAEHTGNRQIEGMAVEANSKRQATQKKRKRQTRKINQETKKRQAASQERRRQLSEIYQQIQEMQQQNGALEEKGDHKDKTQEKIVEAGSNLSHEELQAASQERRRQLSEIYQQIREMQQQNCTAAAKEAKDSRTKKQKDAKTGC